MSYCVMAFCLIPTEKQEKNIILEVEAEQDGGSADNVRRSRNSSLVIFS